MAVRFNPGAIGVPGVGGSLAQGYTNNSGSPGNTTINTPTGRAAIAASAAACTVTCSACLATSKVFVTLESADTTLLYIKQVTVAAGSFTVTGVATSTAACTFSFIVVN